MEIQLGLDIFYFTSYYGDAYMPALGMFYIQNKKQIGNYPFADIFFNFKVKRARVFLKVAWVVRPCSTKSITRLRT